MSKTMPKSTSEEKYRWIKPILAKEISIKDMVKVCPFSERALKYWLSSFKQKGITGLVNKSTRPKTNPKETPVRIKEQIIELRKKTKLCSKKLGWRLDKEGIVIHHRTIGKILKKEGLVRRYRRRKTKPVFKRTFVPGELVEIDIKYVPQRVKNKRYFQFTAIDSATRWRYLKVLDDASSNSAINFLKELIKIAPFAIQAVKTDNGACFTNRYTGYLKSSDILNPRLHEFDLECLRLKINHYLIDPGKPAQNGRVERSHRSDQESFYNYAKFKTFTDLKQKIRIWNNKYNDLEHCALNGLTPNQALGSRVQNVCS